METPRRKTTIEDVARQAGVSVATVSRVVNARLAGSEVVAPATRDRVLQAIRELDYRPSRAGQTLRTRVSHLVALLIPDATNAFYAAIAHSVEVSLRELGYAMILCNTDEDPERQDQYLREMQAHSVSAIVLLGAVDTPELRATSATNTPVIFINRRAPEGLDAPFIGVDNVSAGREVAQYFLSNAWRHVGCIHGPLHSSASRERFEGFRDELSRNGVVLEDGLAVEGDLTIGSGYAVAGSLLTRRPLPQAIFCGNDLMAYGVLRRCSELGLDMDDVALFGFDDNPLNEWLATWLSTVHVPYASFGPAAAEIIRDTTTRPASARREILLPYRLQIRGSRSRNRAKAAPVTTGGED